MVIGRMRRELRRQRNRGCSTMQVHQTRRETRWAHQGVTRRCQRRMRVEAEVARWRARREMQSSVVFGESRGLAMVVERVRQSGCCDEPEWLEFVRSQPIDRPQPFPAIENITSQTNTAYRERTERAWRSYTDNFRTSSKGIRVFKGDQILDGSEESSLMIHKHFRFRSLPPTSKQRWPKRQPKHSRQQTQSV